MLLLLSFRQISKITILVEKKKVKEEVKIEVPRLAGVSAIVRWKL
jgi:hypothetical protein